MNELTAEITISRMIDAPVDLVFRAWTEGEHLTKWYAREGFGVSKADAEAKQGGVFTIVMTGPDGAEYPLWGTYTEFDRPTKLIMSATAAGSDGTPALDAVTTVTLVDHDGKTEMTVHEKASALTPEAAPMLAGMEAGLLQSLRRLDDVVTGAIDRSIVLSRMLDAPREKVFELWTSAEHLANWWGPNGFTLTTHEADIRPGGVWRFTMHGPDGVDYPNVLHYDRVDAPELITFVHGDDAGEMPTFRGTITFDDFQGMTVLTMRTVFQTTDELQRQVEKVGAIEGGNQTLDRLVGYAGEVIKARHDAQ
jgi:uncharacterized protein YndB with AHSA1/START domain